MRDRVIQAMSAEKDFRVSTWMIARRIGARTSRVRCELRRMEREGLVCRDGVSAVNNIIWRLMPRAQNQQEAAIHG